MKGTFRAGDILFTESIAPENVRRGDVLVFFSSRHNDMHSVVAHRVIAHVSGGFVTKGDTLNFPDTNLVCEQHVLGRVIQVQRGSRVYPVKNGWRGRLWAHYLRLRRHLLSFARAPYHWLRASNVTRRLWRPQVASITLATPHGPVVKYLHTGKTVAIWQPDTLAYWCRKPYDLVLDAPLSTTNVHE